MDFFKVKKGRWGLLTVVIAAVLLLLFQWGYPKTELTEVVALAIAIAIFSSFYIEKYLGRKDQKGEEDD